MRKPPIQHQFKKGAYRNPMAGLADTIAWSKRQLNSLIIAESFREVEVTANGKKEVTTVIALAVRQMLPNASAEIARLSGSCYLLSKRLSNKGRRF